MSVNTLAFICCVLLKKSHISVKARQNSFPEFDLKAVWTKAFTKENTRGCGAPLQSVPVYITSLSSSLTHISCYSKDTERIQQEHIMYLDWALLRWCFSLLCLMGAPGLPGLVGQMGREVPGPIWVLNGLSPVCLPSWFRSHVTWPCSQRSPWLHSAGSSHQVCFNLAAHRKHRALSPSPWPDKASESICTVMMNQTPQCTHRDLAVSTLFLIILRV